MSKIPFLESKNLFRDFHKYSKPGKDSLLALNEMRPFDNSGVGRWKDHLPRVKEQIRIHGDITPSLINHGYETDNTWLKLFDAAPDIKFQTQTGETFKRKKLSGRRRKGMYACVNILLEKIGLNAEIILKPVKKLNKLFLKIKITLPVK